MSNPILDRILELAAEGYHPSVVAAEIIGGRWQCRIELSDWGPLGEGGDKPHNVSLDRDELPEGITAAARERFAPTILRLEMPSREDIERWIAEVATVGGAPDWVWIGEDRCLTKPVEWLPEPLRSSLLRRRSGK